MPFREAHAMAGKVVRAAEEKRIEQDKMPIEVYQAIGPFEADVYQVFDPLKSVEKRNAIGGTSLQSVKNQIVEIRRLKTPVESRRWKILDPKSGTLESKRSLYHVYCYLPRM